MPYLSSSFIPFLFGAGYMLEASAIAFAFYFWAFFFLFFGRLLGCDSYHDLIQGVCTWKGCI